MNIKLNTRLSAYSKITAVTTTIPSPEQGSEGDVIGVGTNGKYELFPKVTNEEIDALFVNDLDEPAVITKDEIDELFPEERSDVVSHSAIDSLFN